MDPVIIATLSTLGLGCGIAIFLANRFLPKEPEHLKRAEEISEHLPGMNCGACGHAGCFAYAQALAQDADVIVKSPCMTVMKDEEAVAGLEKKLGISIGGKGATKVAVVHCTGDSPVKYDYRGISTCSAAAQLAGGYKQCLYGCLGLGDCADVCPENAISIESEKKIAVVDSEKCIGCGLCAQACPNGLIEIINSDLPQYLGCSYLSKKNVTGGERCDVGCIHCKICFRNDPDAVEWDEERDLPDFNTKSKEALTAVEKCPKNIIIPRTFEIPSKDEE